MCVFLSGDGNTQCDTNSLWLAKSLADVYNIRNFLGNAVANRNNNRVSIVYPYCYHFRLPNGYSEQNCICNVHENSDPVTLGDVNEFSNDNCHCLPLTVNKRNND